MTSTKPADEREAFREPHQEPQQGHGQGCGTGANTAFTCPGPGSPGKWCRGLCGPLGPLGLEAWSGLCFCGALARSDFTVRALRALPGSARCQPFPRAPSHWLLLPQTKPQGLRMRPSLISVNAHIRVKVSTEIL